MTIRSFLFHLKAWPSVDRVRLTLVGTQFFLLFAEVTMEISTYFRIYLNFMTTESRKQAITTLAYLVVSMWSFPKILPEFLSSYLVLTMFPLRLATNLLRILKASIHHQIFPSSVLSSNLKGNRIIFYILFLWITHICLDFLCTVFIMKRIVNCH